jgi:hypothetical protein
MTRVYIPGDDFDDDDVVTQPDTRPGEPANLDSESLAVRRLWVAAWRAHHLATCGRASHYSPGRRWDVGVGKDPKPVWPQLVRFIRTNNAVPEIFIRAQFVAGYQAPQPNMVMNKAALDRYRACVRRSPGDCALELRIQVNLLKLLYYRRSRPGRSEQDVLRAVLLDQSAEFSPLFRHCQACLAGLDDVAGLFRGSALAQYLSDPASYDEAWGPGLIPVGLGAASGGDVAIAGRVGTS